MTSEGYAIKQLPERFQQAPRSEALTQYISEKYSQHGFPLEHTILYNPEWKPTYSGRERFRCVENPTDGLREVGKAHKIVDLRHTGWFIDNEGYESVHGVVYQLPARKGQPQYVPAVNDPWNDAAILNFHAITDDKEQAARWADSMAESYAESEREYRAKEDAENRLEEIEEEIKTEYAEFRRIAKELRANCDAIKGIGVVRELVKDRWQRTKAHIRKLRAEQRRIEREGITY